MNGESHRRVAGGFLAASARASTKSSAAGVRRATVCGSEMPFTTGRFVTPISGLSCAVRPR